LIKLIPAVTISQSCSFYLYFRYYLVFAMKIKFNSNNWFFTQPPNNLLFSKPPTFSGRKQCTLWLKQY